MSDDFLRILFPIRIFWTLNLDINLDLTPHFPEIQIRNKYSNPDPVSDPPHCLNLERGSGSSIFSGQNAFLWSDLDPDLLTPRSTILIRSSSAFFEERNPPLRLFFFSHFFLKCSSLFFLLDPKYCFTRWSLRLVRIHDTKLDGNLEIGAQVRSNLCDLIFLTHLIRSRADTNRIFSPKRPIFLNACATCSELPTNISTMQNPNTVSGGKTDQREVLFQLSY